MILLALLAAFASPGSPAVEWVCTNSMPPHCRQIQVAAPVASRGPADWSTTFSARGAA